MKELIKNSSAKENIVKLPDFCYTKDLVTGGVIAIKAGERGYYKVASLGRFKTADEYIQYYNNLFEVTPVQKQAMEVGSMFGWEVPGANPDNY